MFRIKFWPMTASPIRAMSALKDEEKVSAPLNPFQLRGPDSPASGPQLPSALRSPSCPPAREPPRPRPLERGEGPPSPELRARGRRSQHTSPSPSAMTVPGPRLPRRSSLAGRGRAVQPPPPPPGRVLAPLGHDCPPPPPFPATGVLPAPAPVPGAEGGPEGKAGAGPARGVLGPEPEEPGPRRPGLWAPRGRAQATPVPRRRREQLRAPSRLSGRSPAARGPSLTEPWRRRRRRRTRQKRRGRHETHRRPSERRCGSPPEATAAASGTGQSEERGGAMQTRHWPCQAPVPPPEAPVTPTPGADSGERRAHR